MGGNFHAEGSGLLGQKPGGEHQAVVAGVRAAGDGGHQDAAVRQPDIVLRACFGVSGVALHGDANGLLPGRASEGALADAVELPLELAQGNAVLRTLGTGDGGLHLLQIELQLGAVVQLALAGHTEEALGAVIVLVGAHMVLRAAGGAQVCGGDLIRREEAHGSTVLRGHVRHGRAVRQGESGGALAEEFHKLAHHPMAAQHLCDVQGQVRRGHAGTQLAGEVHAHHLRHQEGDRLAQHAGLGLDAAHAPSDDAQAVDHRGVRIRAHQGVRVPHAVLLHHAASQVLQVDLMHDTRAGRHHGEGLESLLAPLQKLITLGVALELTRQVALIGTGEACAVHLHGVVHHQIHRHQRLHRGRVLPQILHGRAHRRQIHQQRHPRQVLQNNARHGEGYLVIPLLPGFPPRQIRYIPLCHLQAVAIAQQTLQHNAQRYRHPPHTGIPCLRQRRK